MPVHRLILIALIFPSIVQSLFVNRDQQDIFQADGIYGKDCQSFSAHQVKATDCSCNNDTNIFYNTKSSDHKCHPPTEECKVEVIGSLLIENVHNNFNIQLGNCKKCKKIVGIYVWNLNKPSDKRGSWWNITSKSLMDFLLQGPIIEISTSQLQINQWSGQLLKIEFNGNSCVLLKFAGIIIYPFDTNKLFLDTTQTQMLTTLTTKPVTSHKTTVQSEETRKTTSKTSIISVPSLPASSNLNEEQYSYNSFQDNPFNCSGDNENIQHSPCSNPPLPTWVVAVISVLMVLVVVLLLIILFMCKQWPEHQDRDYQTAHSENVEFKNGGLFHGDKPFSASASSTENNDVKNGSEDVDYCTEYRYSSANITCLYAAANDVSKSPSKASRLKSSKAMVGKTADEDYEDTIDFSQNVYLNMDEKPESIGSYISMDDNFLPNGNPNSFS